MAIPSAIAKQVRYKKEVTFNTAPGASGAQLLRRVDFTMDIEKDVFKSNEKRSDYQISDYRHGVRKTVGKLKGELSPKTYSDFIGAALRRDFAVVTPITAASITIATGSVVNGIQQYTVTRASGSYLTDGVKAADIVRLTVGSFNAANLNKNLYVISLSATVLTVVPLNAVALVAEGPIATSTVTVYGKKTFVPTSGHVDESFAFEDYFADASPVLSELFTGVKAGTISIGLPASGMATIDIDLMGPGSITTATAAYYTSPTSQTITNIAAAVNGILYVSGVAVAICTGLTMKIEGGYGADPVVGANTLPAILPNRVDITGNFTAYFDSGTYRDAFLNESEISLSVVLSCDNTATADFLAITIPRLKLGTAKREDGDKGIEINCDFQALFNGNGGAGISSEQTTLTIQDSAA